MKRHTLVWMWLVASGISAEPTSPPPSNPKTSATLRWKNGESVPGELIAASQTDLTWKTPLFEDPLVLRWDALRRIDQPLATVAGPDPFRIVLRDGSHLLGDLVAVTDQSVSIRSARHGEVILKRSEVLSVRRLRGGKLVAGGPVGDVGWEIGDRTTAAPGIAVIRRAVAANAPLAPLAPAAPAIAPLAIPPLATGPGGALLMPYWNRSAVRALALPELVDLEFRLRSSARPDFRVSLEGDPKQRLRIETWDDELVLRASDQFKSITKIGDDEREVALRVCWDRKAAQCSVFTPAGELVVAWKVPEDSTSGPPGIILQNKGRDLALELLRVRAWDGKPPPKVDLAQPRLELADGRVIVGKVSDGSGDALKVRAPGQETELTFQFAEVDAVIFSTDPPRADSKEATLSYADGTLLFGRFTSIKDGSAALETTFTEQPLPARIDALRQLLIDVARAPETPPEPPLADLDTVLIQQTTLHGKLAGTGDAWPRWLPIGGVTPAMPSKELTVEINRAVPSAANIPSAPALFYTSAGDVLPGSFRLLDRAGVEIESALIENTRLASDQLHAIQFGAVAQTNLEGFSDPGWRVLKGDEKSLRKSADSIDLEPESAIGHPAVMQSNEIKFSFAAKSFGTVRLRLFCAGTDRAQSSNLLLSQMGPRVYVGMESSEGQMENQFQAMVPSGSPITIRLSILEKQVELQVNDVFTRKFSIPPGKRLGSGLVIEPAGTWGNPVNPVTLSEFSAHAVPGRTWLPEVNPEARRHALTVPRFRKDLPPRHVLLAANGDVLRGEIEAVTPGHFGFRSGLETLRVPRERVKAAIWLKKPDESSPLAAVKNPLPEQLDRKISRSVSYSNATLSTLVAFLQRETPELKFKLPEKQADRRVSMQFGEQTITDALEQICTLFGLRYRRESGGTIVLETDPSTPMERVQKVYWLAQSTFPNTASVQDFLATKGVLFPAGSTVLWQPETRQLSMTNTVANHSKLQEVLDQLGGSFSPTHWLLLTNGARLGLAVDKFAPDFISGRHPQYGRCTAAVAHIYSIRTSAPQPTAAMKSLEDWRLVFAPEPVLPETGGESSAALGKEAKPFKLPLLGGGDFDLAQEQGKIVILDFWATWCGPCIKSLPGVIEAMSAFPADRVKLIGVNQSEPAEQVKRFVETRGWKLTVAMDAGQTVARQYGVDGIPHTVIVGPDGKVAWVKTGYHPDAAAEAANVVKQLLMPRESN